MADATSSSAAIVLLTSQIKKQKLLSRTWKLFRRSLICGSRSQITSETRLLSLLRKISENLQEKRKYVYSVILYWNRKITQVWLVWYVSGCVVDISLETRRNFKRANSKALGGDLDLSVARPSGPAQI
ncbi:hypothetical protein EVAR_10524_1 [Eumeta japonica]|uniref:Uncharacterized protein n=1 Tax=Eumeta variegata TaxID=151549 RepID=A0A4C1TIF3_EUMVA|nr:hypothetical protein EVAR_10524_1 [Eumeta japonica]